ncbi:hypothetical protein [Bradyrhizobium embrapense]
MAEGFDIAREFAVPSLSVYELLHKIRAVDRANRRGLVEYRPVKPTSSMGLDRQRA